jgi:hypothetical protein
MGSGHYPKAGKLLLMETVEAVTGVAAVCGKGQYQDYLTGLIFLYMFAIFHRGQGSGIK